MKPVHLALVLFVLGVAPRATAAQAPAKASVGQEASRAVTAGVARPFAAFSDAALSIRDSIVAVARKQVGKRYRLGGTGPRGGFDCSGLVRYVASAFAIELPRTASEQARAGERVAADVRTLRPGDLLTFGRGRISHVGIYVGHGRMVHASSRAGRVIETDIARPRGLPLRGARRVLAIAPQAEDGSAGR